MTVTPESCSKVSRSTIHRYSSSLIVQLTLSSYKLKRLTERTYLCLGQWEEKGVTYTYTMRNDTSTNECFVGTIINDEEIYIKEAGDYCIRNIDPKTEGMRLYRKGAVLVLIYFQVALKCI
jgi:hypothetical protein